MLRRIVNASQQTSIPKKTFHLHYDIPSISKGPFSFFSTWKIISTPRQHYTEEFHPSHLLATILNSKQYLTDVPTSKTAIDEVTAHMAGYGREILIPDDYANSKNLRSAEDIQKKREAITFVLAKRFPDLFDFAQKLQQTEIQVKRDIEKATEHYFEAMENLLESKINPNLTFARPIHNPESKQAIHNKLGKTYGLLKLKPMTPEEYAEATLAIQLGKEKNLSMAKMLKLTIKPSLIKGFIAGTNEENTPRINRP